MVSKNELLALTVKTLKGKAKAAGIKGYSRLNKASLVALIIAGPPEEEKDGGPKKTTPRKRKEIKVKKGDRITVGHAIINIYTGGNSHPDYPIPQNVANAAVNANQLDPQSQREILSLANQGPAAPTLRKRFHPPTPPEIVTTGWKGRAKKPPPVELTPAQKKAAAEAEARRNHMGALAEAIAARRKITDGQ